ncbi:MAG TPA: hypothetical protein VFP98_00750 [Candidatus Polarisedimenticolia bacterium]|nr:hypothetical protein [Candidatus Polarisedimenticolia bacterium]
MTPAGLSSHETSGWIGDVGAGRLRRVAAMHLVVLLDPGLRRTAERPRGLPS